MQLNRDEVEKLYQFLGRIDITLIPPAHFLAMVVLHERLAGAIAKK